LQRQFLPRKPGEIVHIPANITARPVKDQSKRMLQAIEFLAPALLATLLLTGVHAWFGIQLVERREVLTGLALAQIAALGTAIAILRGVEAHAWESYGWSLALTLIAGALFSVVPVQAVPTEAARGMVFAVALAAAIVALSNTTGQTDHLRDMLFGNILAVNSATIGRRALLYAVVGFVQFVFRKKRTDLLFYLSLAVVVTSSVPIAGVMVVFAFLIFPGTKRFATAWTISALVSVIGVLLSFKLDLPTGATIVCTLGIALVVMVAFAKRREAESQSCRDT
jgi:zinc/manganese transport system permease protein